jgi:hypothetical protein
MTTSRIVLRILASFSTLSEGANGTLGHKGSDFSCRVALPSPLMGNVQEATSVSAVTVGAAEDGPRTTRPSRGSTLQLLGHRDGCHAAADLFVGADTEPLHQVQP